MRPVGLRRFLVTASFKPMGTVHAARRAAEDDSWGGEEACITLTHEFTADALKGLSDFSHVEVLYWFHRVEPAKIVSGARHPRNNEDWPSVGIFAQRAKNRPNRHGSTISRVVPVEGTKLFFPSSMRSTGHRFSISSQ